MADTGPSATSRTLFGPDPMLQNLPAEPGMPIDAVDTPALIVDLDALAFNLDTMASMAATAGVKLRPHAKTHKSPVVAHLQMARGAVGQCVQKVAEAEVLAWGGVSDILVSNEVVSPRKLARLAALTMISTVAVCADDRRAIEAIETAARDAGVPPHGPGRDRRRGRPLRGRAGAGGRDARPEDRREPAPALRRACRPTMEPPQHQRTPEERSASIAAAATMTGRVVDDLRQVGLDCAIVGGAGTGTFALEAASGVYTELQVGSYVFMDADYGRNQPAPPFRNALFVLSTVMSAPRAALAVIDAGHKAVAVDSGLPLVWERPRHHLCRRLGRTRQSCTGAECRTAAPRPAGLAGAGPLRPHGRPLRLVRRRAQRPGRMLMARRGPGRHDMRR